MEVCLFYNKIRVKNVRDEYFLSPFLNFFIIRLNLQLVKHLQQWDEDDAKEWFSVSDWEKLWKLIERRYDIYVDHNPSFK